MLVLTQSGFIKVKLCDEDDNETDDWFAAAVKKREEQGKRLVVNWQQKSMSFILSLISFSV